MTTTHYRTCSICEANCGLKFEMDSRTVVRITGDSDNPLSRGHICPKGTALADIQDDPDRLRKPVRRVGDNWQEVEWDDAFADIGKRLAAIRQADELVTMYFGNPTAHNYAALIQIEALIGTLGSPPPYSASTIDHMPTMLVQMWMYGHNFLFPVVDIDRTRHFLVIGANPVVSNGSLMVAPNFRGRIKSLRARGGTLTVIDPRRTETAALADEHQFIRPGTDAGFLAALLLVLDRKGLVAHGKLAPMLSDWDEALAALRAFEVNELARWCGIEVEAIERIAVRLTDGPSAVYGRMGISTQPFGTLCAWLIQLINVATGNLDREGGLLFSDPPLDMVELTPPGSYDSYRSRVSGHPETMNELPVAALAEEIATPGPGQIRGLVTVSGNPVLSTPNGTALDRALDGIAFMVSVDMYINETSRHADYILPPCGPLEKDHYPWYLGPMMVRHYANYSHPVLPMEEGTLAEWEILQKLAAAIAQASGREAPPMPEPRDALDQALRASPRGLTLQDVEADVHGIDLGPLFPRLPERLKTTDKTIHCAPPHCIADLERLRTEMSKQIEKDALLLIGRRQVRSNNSWLHNSYRLAKGPARCTLFLHPDDALHHGLEDGDMAEVRSEFGVLVVPVEVTGDIMPGVASLPHGFGHMRAGVRERVAQARQPGVSFNDLTGSHTIDPLSGNAAVNGFSVRVARAEPV